MNNNQDNEIVVLIQDVIAGNAEKKELCNRIYKEVYALAYPVYQDEEKSRQLVAEYKQLEETIPLWYEEWEALQLLLES